MIGYFDIFHFHFDEYNSVNYEGTKLLAESAVAAGVRRLVFVSTIKVNGEMTKRKPFSQSDSPSPLGPYSISKWEAEKALFEIHNTKNLELVILRAPLVYGPHVKGNFSALLEACAQQKLLPFKAITNLRSFLYVGNLASAITICLGHPCANGKTYLLSDGEDMSTPELIRRISKAMGVDSRLFSLPFWLLALICRLVGRKEAIERLTNSLQIDTTLIKEELGWHPPYSVNDGLQRTAHWFLEDEVKR